jgi:hypothetical protein
MESFEEGTEIVRVYLAAALSEARAVEAALDAAEVEFAVEVESFASTSLLANAARSGAGFWVRAPELDRAADALASAGHVAGLVDRGR